MSQKSTTTTTAVAAVSLGVAISALGLSLFNLYQGQQAASKSGVDSEVATLRAEIVEAQKESTNTFEKRVEAALESIIERRQAEAAEARKQMQKESTSVGDLDSTGMLSMNDEGQVVYGNPDAPVTIISFEDFRCHFCNKYHPELQQFVNDSDGQVNWIYKPYPILGPASQSLAEAGECVSQLEGAEAFWRYADQAYASQNWRTAVKYADLQNTQAVVDCVTNGGQSDRVAQSLADGRDLNITGTPASVFRNNETEKGAFVPGFLQPNQIAQMVQEVTKSE